MLSKAHQQAKNMFLVTTKEKLQGHCSVMTVSQNWGELMLDQMGIESFLD